MPKQRKDRRKGADRHLVEGQRQIIGTRHTSPAQQGIAGAERQAAAKRLECPCRVAVVAAAGGVQCKRLVRSKLLPVQAAEHHVGAYLQVVHLAVELRGRVHVAPPAGVAAQQQPA